MTKNTHEFAVHNAFHIVLFVAAPNLPHTHDCGNECVTENEKVFYLFNLLFFRRLKFLKI